MSELHLRYGAMAAGKSVQLLRTALEYEADGGTVQVFTAAIDDRAGHGVVASRLGTSRPGRVYDNNTVFGAYLLGHPSCVLVDEAQFLLERHVRELHRYAHIEHVPVICFGLRTDFRGMLFEGSAALLALADSIQEIASTCACGRKATMNTRINSDGVRERDGAQVEIGGSSRYRGVCGGCFYS